MSNGVVEQAGKVGTATVEAMKSTPLAIALLVVNVGFLGFAAYVLGEVATNASERNKTQMELITNLVRDCLQTARPSPTRAFPFPLPKVNMPSETISDPAKPGPVDDPPKRQTDGAR